MGENLRKARPQKVSVFLDKERNLLYDMNAFAELEEIFGSVEAALEALGQGKIKALRAILWAGLVHEDEKLTERSVGALIGLGDLGEVADALNKAISNALPEAEETAEKADPNA